MEQDMNAIAELLNPCDVLLDLKVSTPHALFEAVARQWESQISPSDVISKLEARERLGATALGRGVAIPHARVTGLKQAMAAFVRPATPIMFEAPDGEAIAFFLVLVVPIQATELHLKILAETAAMLSNTDFRDQLARLTKPEDVRRLFAHWRDPIAQDM